MDYFHYHIDLPSFLDISYVNINHLDLPIQLAKDLILINCSIVDWCYMTFEMCMSHISSGDGCFRPCMVFYKHWQMAMSKTVTFNLALVVVWPQGPMEK